MKRCCFCSNPEDIVTPKEKRNVLMTNVISIVYFCVNYKILKNVVLSNISLYSLSLNLSAICLRAYANGVRRMSNGVFNAMADEEYL
ncbi:hypothetical protein T4D_3790 [Trichinella pseudospiralis]|uniref:Uncharacterized protein n=1 Tax=Trichinella pseudospiralis TaxID=6337 RepID=A0A0V1FKM2_TRIPS|nr:hypothetical protein T4D_3790 [Trichinella pseudospiralis]